MPSFVKYFSKWRLNTFVKYIDKFFMLIDFIDFEYKTSKYPVVEINAFQM